MINEQLLREAIDLHGAGQVDEAWNRYQRLLAENPNDPDLIHLTGVLAGQVGNLLESARLIQQAIGLRPDAPDFHKNLAITYRRLEDYPKAAEAFVAQGDIFVDGKHFEEAIAAYEQAAILDPKSEHAVNNLGATLNRVGRYEDAHERLMKALAPDPRMPPSLAHWNGKPVAGGFLKQLPALHLNLGNALHGLGDIDGALASYERALELKPDSVNAHNDISLLLLLKGRLEEGWREMEWRWQDEHYLAPRGFDQPVWKGESPEQLAGRLLIISEQGYGDTIMFARYVLIMADHGYDILFEVKPELFTLFSEGLLHPRVRVIPARMGEPRVHDDLAFAAYTGILSLPGRLGTTMETIPGQTPYLTVAPERLWKWQKRIEQDTSKLKIGLVWGGNPNYIRNHERSIPPHFLAPLLDRDDVTFYSLQKGPAAAYRFPKGNVVTLDSDLEDFADTAAAIANLDVVISSCTSVVHLAGALNVPNWIMLMKIADWRWFLDREDSPWYPRTRLFRQPQRGDWPSTVAAVRRSLDELVKG